MLTKALYLFIASLSISSASKESSPDPRALASAAQGLGLYIGAAISLPRSETHQDYDKLETQNYDLITAENACKMNKIANSFTDLDPTGCIELRDMAAKNGQAFRAHNLVWANTGTHNPVFVRDETDYDKLESFMLEYINATVRAVGGAPTIAWDVVNEAVSDEDGVFIRHSPWNNITDFICKAFKATRSANAEVGRFYNDFNIITSQSKSDKVYKLVKDLHDRDCGITGVGMQSHVTTNYGHYDLLRENMKQYEELGLDVHITELSVKCANCSETWTDAELQKQAEIYGNILTTCLQAPNCKSFETWGFTDKYSFLPDPEDGMPFDKAMHAKPAYDKLYSILKSFPRDHPAVIQRISGYNSQEQFLQ